MIANANSIVQLAIQNGIMKYANTSVEIIVHAKKIIDGIFPTGTPRRNDVVYLVFDVWTLYRRIDDITSIHGRPNFDEFSRHFDVLIWCNFTDRKIHVISTYFLNVISMVEKSKLLPRTFFDLISLVEKFLLFSLTFFDVVLMVKKSTCFQVLFLTKLWLAECWPRFWLSCKLMKTFEEVFCC